MTRKEENVMELSFLVAQANVLSDEDVDTMDVKNQILRWADEFETLYPVDWNDCEEDYYLAIEDFGLDRINEAWPIIAKDGKEKRLSMAMSLFDTLKSWMIDSKEDTLLKKWYIFPEGTTKKEIQDWFEKRYHINAIDLIWTKEEAK